MIARIWHGWTTPENADTYENLLKNEIFTGIQNKNIAGFKGIKLLRRPHKDEVEFITFMTFESIDSLKKFAGDNYETAYVPDKAKAFLKRYDPISQHYELRHEV